jgi:hypothetical protein
MLEDGLFNGPFIVSRVGLRIQNNLFMNFLFQNILLIQIQSSDGHD